MLHFDALKVMLLRIVNITRTKKLLLIIKELPVKVGLRLAFSFQELELKLEKLTVEEQQKQKALKKAETELRLSQVKNHFR